MNEVFWFELGTPKVDHVDHVFFLYLSCLSFSLYLTFSFPYTSRHLLLPYFYFIIPSSFFYSYLFSTSSLPLSSSSISFSVEIAFWIDKSEVGNQEPTIREFLAILLEQLQATN